MMVRDIMTRDVDFVWPEDSIRIAADKMRRFDIGIIPVLSAGKAKGIITDRDITLRAVAEGYDPNTTRVSEVMTPLVIWCSEDTDISDAVKLMENNMVRRLMVEDREGAVIGVVSLSDIAQKSDRMEACEAFSAISKTARA